MPRVTRQRPVAGAKANDNDIAIEISLQNSEQAPKPSKRSLLHDSEDKESDGVYLSLNPKRVALADKAIRQLLGLLQNQRL